MMVKKLTKEEVEFLKKMSNQVYDGENAWYYLPFWFKQVDEDKFEVTQFENLPEKVIEVIKDRHCSYWPYADSLRKGEANNDEMKYHEGLTEWESSGLNDIPTILLEEYIGDLMTELKNRNQSLRIQEGSGSVYLDENQIAELAQIGSRHLYLGVMDEGRISYGGIIEILKRYEEFRKADC